jgi:Tfp pilus assembly protein PilF
VVLRVSSLIVLCFAPLVSFAGSTPAKREIRFGIDVAQKGLWREARFRFEKAVEADPKDASAHNNLAIALEQEGEFAKAKECYEKALALKPGDTYIQQNYDLFREADEKRNRKQKKR